MCSIDLPLHPCLRYPTTQSLTVRFLTLTLPLFLCMNLTSAEGPAATLKGSVCSMLSLSLTSHPHPRCLPTVGSNPLRPLLIPLDTTLLCHLTINPILLYLILNRNYILAPPLLVECLYLSILEIKN
jgi:hypothetical protein